MEDEVVAEVERRLKAMNIGTQQVAQVQPLQAVNCEIYGGPHFSMHCVATVQQIEEINFLKQNNPYSNTYNSGWKNHPNFSWKDQQGNVQKQGPSQYQNQQQQQYPPQQQQYQQLAPKTADWKLAIEKMTAQNSQLQEETRNNHMNTTASIKNIEVQMGHIAQ